jgi:restriction endonuclease S subunit
LYTTGLGTIRKSELQNIKIPLLSLEKQKEIINYCDELSTLISKLDEQIEKNTSLMKGIIQTIG